MLLTKPCQRAATTEKTLKNKVDQITWLIDINRVLSATPLLEQYAYEQSGHGDRDGGSAWRIPT